MLTALNNDPRMQRVAVGELSNSADAGPNRSPSAGFRACIRAYLRTTPVTAHTSTAQNARASAKRASRVIADRFPAGCQLPEGKAARGRQPAQRWPGGR